MKKLIVFDLDGTLAESKSALDAEMATLLSALLGVVRVAIISGGDWPQFEKQVLANLPHDESLKHLFLIPTDGTKFYQYKTGWEKLYSEDFTAGEKEKQMEDRGSQITWSALGQQAPLEEKKKWDPDFAKRQQIKAILSPSIPEFSVGLGGTTSIDVTKPGIDKAYGIGKLRDILGIAIDEMIYIGDALFAGGNDYPARKTGVVCIQVRDPEETKRVIEAIIACLKGGQQTGPKEGESR